MASLEDAEETLNLHGSMDPALLPDITTTYEHMQRSDGSVGLVEKANSGRMSPIRKRSVKDTKQQIETLEKENFDLKLRIYFLENQKGVNKDDTLKVNIDLRVQLQSFHQETGYENHIEELEQRLQTDQSADLVRDYESLKLKLATAELRCVSQVCCV
ncbi:CDK5RAP2 [Bugula neritina]|uniref:CDK5RAP2 n=1 Tax=Bugula neritina TaxID=10212 RepID=A0A7J7JMF6_BUGNE|nr:CDK5RAP2 [Bugula neritina]